MGHQQHILKKPSQEFTLKVHKQIQNVLDMLNDDIESDNNHSVLEAQNVIMLLDNSKVKEI